MDRLISEQDVIDAMAEALKHGEGVHNLLGRILAIPSAEPYKGMTNGQVHDMLYQMLVELKDGADRYGAEKWWNSPYQKGGKKRDYDAEFRNHSEMILNAQKVRDKE